jgi:hypothetical protein
MKQAEILTQEQMLAHVREHIKTRYRFIKCAAYKWGMHQGHLSKMLHGDYRMRPAILAECGIEVVSVPGYRKAA